MHVNAFLMALTRGPLGTLARIQDGLRKILAFFSTLIGMRASFVSLRWCVSGVDRDGAFNVSFVSDMVFYLQSVWAKYQLTVVELCF